jgi:hypothetical protein
VFSSLKKKDSENNLLFVRFCDDSIEQSGLFSVHNLCFVEAAEEEEEAEEKQQQEEADREFHCNNGFMAPSIFCV